MKRLVSLAAAGLMCGGALLAVPGVAGAATSTPNVHAAVSQPGGRMIRAAGHSNSSTFPQIALNWSGYAATSKHPFTSVHSTFVQPSVHCPGIANQWTSNWVGLDGFNDQTVEQDGTFGFCGGKNHTTPRYEAWIELFPKPSVNAFPVHPGDIMSASVDYAHGKFTLTIADLTTGKSRTTAASCTSCKRASAEWIVERPALCANKTCTKAMLGELADFRSTTMSNNTASVAGGAAKSVGNFHNVPIDMINNLSHGFISLDTVGALSGPSFTATWDRHGTTVPISLGPDR
jgi:Peptidase A4 family